MKICIPTIEKTGFNEKTRIRFSDANYFTIFDTKANQVESIKIDNSIDQNNFINFFVANNITIILANGIAKDLIDNLNKENIKVYIVEGKNVKEALAKFTNNELSEVKLHPVDENHECNH